MIPSRPTLGSVQQEIEHYFTNPDLAHPPAFLDRIMRMIVRLGADEFAALAREYFFMPRPHSSMTLDNYRWKFRSHLEAMRRKRLAG